MAKFLKIVEWDQFQHYKDRNPQWIKLHTSLLSSPVWWKADDGQKALIVVVMLMAARHGNNIPADPLFIQQIGYLKVKPNLNWLVKQGFCVYSDAEERRESPWPSRYIPDEIRGQVLARDGNQCVKCKSPNKLEIDHIVPVSKGGKGEIDNLQTLCIKCNRSKRNRVASRYADATQTENQRSLEKSREEDINPLRAETESPHLEKRDLEPPSNSDELIEQIAKLHPANWHWKKSSSIQIPPAQCDAIIRAFGRDGFDAVLAGTKNYSEAVNEWPIEGRRFVKGVVKFYDDKDYLRDPREWKTEKTSDKWEKFMEAKA